MEKQLDSLKSITIKDEQELKKISLDLVLITKAIKNITSLKEEETKPLNEGLSKVRNRYKISLLPYEGARDAIKEGIINYYLKESQKAIEASVASGEQEELPVKKILTEEGTVFLKSRWVYEVTDPAKVDKRFYEISSQKINEEIAMGLRGADGIKIYQTIDVAVR